MAGITKRQAPFAHFKKPAGNIETLPFHEMLTAWRANQEVSQKECAKILGISAQYLCDLEAGRRLPSVRVVTAICDTHESVHNATWHTAGALAHGWKL